MTAPIKTRTLMIHTRLTPAELRLYRRVARIQDQTLSAWIRSTLEAEAEAVLKSVPSEVRRGR